MVSAGDRGLHWRCTARQNYEYFLGLGRKEVNQIIDSNINLFGNTMEELLDKRLETMSFGQKKLVALFLSYLSKANYLIYDEITEGMDIDVQKQIIDITSKLLAQNKCIIFATHDLSFASHVSDEIVFMCKGSIYQVVQECNQEFLLKTYQEMRENNNEIV